MMVFNVCVNDTVQLLYSIILLTFLLMISFDWWLVMWLITAVIGCQCITLEQNRY